VVEQAKGNVNLLLEKMRGLSAEQLKPDFRFIISLCLELNKCDMDMGQEFGALGGLEKWEQTFYDRHIEQILSHGEHVGVSQSYHHLVTKITDTIRSNSENPALIQSKLWRVEDSSSRTAYFMATFEHLMTKHHSQETSFALFGFWKLYGQLYRRKGWNFNLVCTMLED
jgi:hypothetical protein